MPPLIDPKGIFTPAARTAFELIQFLAWIGGIGFMMYHFLVVHSADAQTIPTGPTRGEFRALQEKLDTALELLQAFEVDMAVVEDRLDIPVGVRGAARRHPPHVPVSSTNVVP